jgi:hypothetical protein
MNKQLILNKVKATFTNPAVLAAMFTAALVIVPKAAFAASGDLVLDLEFDSALTTIFDYSEMLFPALIGIAAIGLGFQFAGGLVDWVSNMLGKVFRR